MFTKIGKYKQKQENVNKNWKMFTKIRTVNKNMKCIQKLENVNKKQSSKMLTKK